MSRIANYASQQILNSYLQKVQQRLNNAQVQLTSEKRAQDYMGIGYDTQRLVSYEVDVQTLTKYKANNDIQDIVLQSTEPALTGIETTIQDFRKAMTSYNTQNVVNEDSIRTIQQQAFRSLQAMESYLNTEVNGRFIFSGNRTNTAPVNFGLSTLAAFQQKFDGVNTTYPTTRDMHVESFDISKDSAGQTNWLTFTQDSDGSTLTSGSSTITSTTAQFANVTVGSTIEITGTASNNGTYQVNAVSNGGKTIQVKTVMLTDEAATAAPTLTPTGTINTAIAQVDTVTLAGTVGDTGDTYSVVVNGTSVTYTTDGTEASINVIRDNLVALINANGTIAANVTAAPGGAGALTLTAVTAGNAQTVTSSATNVALGTNDNTASSLTTTANAASTLSTSPLTAVDFTTLTFNRAAGTITAAKAGAFTGLVAGSSFTITGSAQNNGTYYVETAGTTQITIKQTKLTDEGGSMPVNYGPAAPGLTLTANGGANDDTIVGPAGTFTGAVAGMKIALTGTTGGTNNGVYTINTVSADGSTVTIDEVLPGGTQALAATLMAQVRSASPVPTLSFGPGNLTFTKNASTFDTISAAAGTFSNLSAGMKITTAGTASNNSTFTIVSVSSDGSSVNVLETLTTEAATGDEIATVPLAAGTVKSVSYYQGDTFTHTHKVSKNTNFTVDLNALDPAFERAIRAMGLIAQGKFGTAGGLEQTANAHRLTDAVNLVDLSLNANDTTNPQYEIGYTNNLEQAFITLGYQRSLMNNSNEIHTRLIGFYESRISSIENVDPLDVITRLLDDQKSLEASYQAMATIRSLSLHNYLK